MADRVHPTPPPPATETTPLQQHPSFHRPPPGSSYIAHVPKDQVLRVPPPDRARRYKKLAARPARRRQLRRACCLSCAALLLLILLFAAFAGAVYLVFRPRAPSFSVASLSIRGGLLPDDPQAAVEIAASIRADNARNRKVGFDYRGGGEVTVAYSGARLAAGPWPAFRQPPRNVTVFSTSLTGKDVTFTDEHRRQQLSREQAAGAVPLSVEAVVPVRLRLGKVLRTWTVDVKATCEVAVDRIDGTPAAVNNSGCRVKVKPLWWWL